MIANARLFLARHENRSVITAPWLVRRNEMKGEPIRIEAIESGARLCFVRTVATLMLTCSDSSSASTIARSAGTTRSKESGKADSLASRPGKPGRGVRFPFRRHAIAELSGRFRVFIHSLGNALRRRCYDAVGSLRTSKLRIRESVSHWRFLGMPSSSGWRYYSN